MLNMRVEPTQKKLLEKAAEVTGQSVTSFVLAHAVQAAQRELEEVRSYSLTLKDAQAFMSAVESPTSPNSALKRAFSDYEKKYSRSR